MTKKNMTDTEKLKDLLFSYTDRIRHDMIRILDYLKVIEDEIDRRVVCQDGDGTQKQNNGTK